ncbi:MAG: hypothetical protein ACI9ES_003554 [Oceanospirillaceae bacterium]
MFGKVAAAWGFIGVCMFLGSAISRLLEVSSQLQLHNFAPIHWAIMIIWVFFMAYFEGYKGFQKGFSPRVAARLYYLANHATVKRFIFAPFFCLGFFDAERKRIVFIVCLSVAIFSIVQLVGYLPMPWRGILDVGVVIGLSWGLVSMIIFSAQIFSGKKLDFPAGVPEN